MLVLIWIQTVRHSDTVILKKSFEKKMLFSIDILLSLLQAMPRDTQTIRVSVEDVDRAEHSWMWKVTSALSAGKVSCRRQRYRFITEFTLVLSADNLLQTVRTQIRTNKMLVLIWIKTVRHSDTVILKKSFEFFLFTIDILLSPLQAMPGDTQTIQASAEDWDRVEHSWMWKVTSALSAGKVSCRRQRYRFIFGPIQARGLSRVDFAEKHLNGNNI